jgi:hypothetical protein
VEKCKRRRERRWRNGRGGGEKVEKGNRRRGK